MDLKKKVAEAPGPARRQVYGLVNGKLELRNPRRSELQAVEVDAL